MSGQNWKAGLALMAAVLAFWAGMQFQVIRDHDRCLDQGGALQPGRHPLCVAKSASETGLWIGPLQIRAGDIVAIEHAGAAPRLVLTLDPAAAKSLHEYTRQHIGHELAIRVNGRVIQQMSIVQALGATFVLPAWTFRTPSFSSRCSPPNRPVLARARPVDRARRTLNTWTKRMQGATIRSVISIITEIIEMNRPRHCCQAVHRS